MTDSVVTDDGPFKLGDLVEKKGRASWRGKIVGEYSTELTARGYAVESVFEPGSVQIYPESALVPYTVTDGGVVERVAQALSTEAETKRFFMRRAIDKSCYEVVHDLDPDGPITDESFKVVDRFDTAEDAHFEVSRLTNEHLARAALAASDRVVLVERIARLEETLKAIRQWFLGYKANFGDVYIGEEIALIDAALVSLEEELTK
jgi:hypothetical protein